MLTRCASEVSAPAGAGFPPNRAWFIGGLMDRAANSSEQSAAGRELAPLLSGIATGDRAALATLYERTSAKLFGICIRLLPSEADAEDVLQDVYLTVWRKAGLYDQAKASPITWLAVMATRWSCSIRCAASGTSPCTPSDPAP